MRTYLSPVVLDTDRVPIRDIMRNRARVVVSRLETSPGLLNGVENAATTGAGTTRKGNSPLGGVLRVFFLRQRARVGLVEVQVVGFHFPVGVPGLLSNPAEKVGTAVPATKRRKTPVGGQGGDYGVVGVEGVILLALEVLRDSAAKKKSEDLVSDLVGVGLIEGELNQSVLGKVLVLEQFSEEAVGPTTGKGDVGVVGIVSHVRSNEHVLREFLVLQVIVEAGKILNLADASVIIGDRVEENQRVVLADVVARVGLGEAVALVAGVGQVFLVLAPGDVLRIEEIRNSRDVGGKLDKFVMVHTPGITTSGGTVVGLRRVREGPEVGQGDTLLGELGEVGVLCGSFIVLCEDIVVSSRCVRSMRKKTYRILQPDIDKPVKRQTLDIRNRRVRLNSRPCLCDFLGRRVMRALRNSKRKTSEEGDDRTLGVHDANNAEKLDSTGMFVEKQEG